MEALLMSLSNQTTLMLFKQRQVASIRPNVCLCVERGHGDCRQSYKINTIIPAITSLSTNIFISLMAYFRGLFFSKFNFDYFWGDIAMTRRVFKAKKSKKSLKNQKNLKTKSKKSK